jgi:sigma-B regulation protein RsbU (phosphoserine phosphatase)
MRLSIRWKLILLIGIPLVLTYVGMLSWDYIRLRKGAIEQMQELVSERAQTQAGILNARLQAAMQLAESVATSLARQPAANDAQIRTWLNTSREQNQWVSSLGAIFAGASESERPRAVIVRRGPGGPRGGPDPPEFDYAQMPIYSEVAADHKPRWLDARTMRGFGPGAVSAYSVPIVARDGFKGVVAVTVGVEDLQQSRPRPPPRGRGGRGGRGMPPASRPATAAAEIVAAIGADAVAIIAPDGRILSPPPDPQQPPRPTLLGWAEQNNVADLAAEFRAALAGESTVVRVADMGDMIGQGWLTTGEDYWLALAPIPATGWVLAAAVPESQAIAPIIQRLWHRAAFLVGGLLLLLVVVTFVSIRISRPIERMAAAVDQLAGGNLDARVADIRGRDELAQLANAFNSMTQQLKSHVAALTEQTAAREKVEAEMRIARQIQTDLLPKVFPPFPERTEFELHALNVPARRVAGDFYDFFFTGNDLLTIVIGDVSGKGMPAALLMAVTRTIIRNLAMEGRSPSQIIDRTNTLLLSDLTNSMFVTLFLCQYNPSAGRITYVNAGHPRPYRFGTNGGPRQFGEITGALVGVGAVEEIGGFEQRVDQLDVGETLLLYTDGITEARSADGTMLGDTGVRELIQRHGTEAVESICRHVVEEVNRYQQNQPADDITILALRRRGVG